MDKSNFLELKLPSRNNTTDVADINVISENFEIIDEAFENIIDDVLPEYQTKENMRSVISDAIVSDKYYPSLNAVRDYIKPRDEKIKNHEKRITNVEKRFANEPFEIDDEWGMTKIVPDGVMPYASVNKVGGMSYKSRNLLNVNRASTVSGGITIIINADKSITYEGTATTGFSYAFCDKSYYIPKGNYKMLGTGWSIELIKPNNTVVNYNAGASFEAEEGCKIYPYIWFSNGTTYEKNTIYPMLVRADETDTSYEPYYSGLRNAYVSQITSVGKNLYNGGNLSFTKYKLVELSQPLEVGTYTVSCTLTTTDTRYGGAIITFVEGGENGANVHVNIEKDKRVSKTFTLSSPVNFVRFHSSTSFADSEGYDATYTDIQIELGTEATEYEPYKAIEPFTIPTGARGVGYGMGINENCYNYIDFERGVYVQNCAEVNLGSLSWTYDTSGKFFWTVLAKMKKLGVGICEKYPVSQTWGVNLDKAICRIYTHHSDALNIKDSSYTDAATLKAALNGVYLIYELATPIETDISDYIQDNFIEVQSGGILTAVNEYNYDTQFEVEYMMGG